MPLPLKYLWFLVYNITFRTFFYSAFMLQEGALIASGMGYNGKDHNKEDRWDTVNSCSIIEAEKTVSAVKFLSCWNHQVHLWLKYYVQHRIVKFGQHAGIAATLGTFMVSALWHGIYPMYFACFFYIYLCSEISKDFFKAGDKFTKVWPLCYELVRYICAYVGTGLNCAFFCLMWRLRDPKRVNQFGSSIYWHPPILLITCLVLSRLTGFAKTPRPSPKDQTKVKTK